MMSDFLTDLSPATLAPAVKANLYAFFQLMRDPADSAERSDGFRWHTRIPHAWFNGIVSTTSPPADATRMIADAVSYFQAHDVTSFSWWLAPHLEPALWSEHLLAHGFQANDSTPGMAIDLNAMPDLVQSKLTVRRIQDPGAIPLWSRTLVRGFEMPEEMGSDFAHLLEDLGTELPIRHYLGYLDDVPVATSTLFLAAGVAGIYNVATVKEARGKGIGSAMTLAPLQEARALGYRAGILQASDMGYSVYRRLGFQKVCQMDYFYWQAGNSQE